jgi:hypothetical protein
VQFSIYSQETPGKLLIFLKGQMGVVSDR